MLLFFKRFLILCKIPFFRVSLTFLGYFSMCENFVAYTCGSLSNITEGIEIAPILLSVFEEILEVSLSLREKV